MCIRDSHILGKTSGAGGTVLGTTSCACTRHWGHVLGLGQRPGGGARPRAGPPPGPARGADPAASWAPGHTFWWPNLGFSSIGPAKVREKKHLVSSSSSVTPIFYKAQSHLDSTFLHRGNKRLSFQATRAPATSTSSNQRGGFFPAVEPRAPDYTCPWHLAPGTRHLAPGTWHLAPKTWHLAPGTWHWHLAPGTWHLAPRN